MRSSNLQKIWQALFGVVVVAIFLISPSFKWLILAALVYAVGHVIISKISQNNIESDLDINPNSSNEYRNHSDIRSSDDSDKK